MGNACGCGCGHESNDTIINPDDLRLARRTRANLARIASEGVGEKEDIEGDTMVFRKQIRSQYSGLD